MRRIIIEAGMCVPARITVTGCLDPYGVRYQCRDYWVDVNTNAAVVTVSNQAAAWTEYLILRSGRYRLRSKPIDKRNLRWAKKWRAMPTPWVEPGCKLRKNGKGNARKERRSWWRSLFG